MKSVNSKCIVCSVEFSIPLANQESSQHIFNCKLSTFCDYLCSTKANGDSWNFCEEAFPFCQKCRLKIDNLYRFDEQLKLIKREISLIVSSFASTIIESEAHERENLVNNSIPLHKVFVDEKTRNKVTEVRKAVCKCFEPHVILKTGKSQIKDTQYEHFDDYIAQKESPASSYFEDINTLQDDPEKSNDNNNKSEASRITSNFQDIESFHDDEYKVEDEQDPLCIREFPMQTQRPRKEKITLRSLEIFDTNSSLVKRIDIDSKTSIAKKLGRPRPRKQQSTLPVKITKAPTRNIDSVASTLNVSQVTSTKSTKKRISIKRKAFTVEQTTRQKNSETKVVGNEEKDKKPQPPKKSMYILIDDSENEERDDNKEKDIGLPLFPIIPHEKLEGYFNYGEWSFVKTDSGFQCQICEEILGFSENDIARHINIVHQPIKDKAEQDNTSRITMDEEKVVFNYRRRAFIKVDVGFSCVTCGENALDENLMKRHINENHAHSSGKFICPKCGLSRPTQAALDKHKCSTRKNRASKVADLGNGKYTYDSWPYENVMMNDGALGFKCSMCGTQRRMLAYMTTHIREHHIDPARFVCDACGKAFSNKKSFQYHHGTHFASDAPKFQCEICGRGCSTRHIFYAHMQSHRKEKTTCNVCHKSFRFKSLKGHRDATGHQPEKVDLVIHSCSMCHRIYASQSTLDIHKLKCKGETLYPCLICGKTRTTKWKLKQHLEECHKDMITPIINLTTTTLGEEMQVDMTPAPEILLPAAVIEHIEDQIVNK